MTPTPQSLDTVTLDKVALEAAREAWLNHASDYTRLDDSIAASIRAYLRALAIKPTPAGEGRETTKFEDDCSEEEEFKRLERRVARMGFRLVMANAGEQQRGTGPAASPVQGVDAIERAARILHDTYWLSVHEDKELAMKCANASWDYAQGFRRTEARALAAAGLLTATPQAPSTVVVTDKMVAAAMHVNETTAGLPFSDLVHEMIRAALDASREK